MIITWDLFHESYKRIGINFQIIFLDVDISQHKTFSTYVVYIMAWDSEMSNFINRTIVWQTLDLLLLYLITSPLIFIIILKNSNKTFNDSRER